MAQLFDPEKYRVVLFDQRGCGRSRRKSPSDGAADQLEANTTWHLVEDLEALREHLGVERWAVGGGSWGTCLALAYASRHAERVLGMALRAVCLFRGEELEFFCGSGPGARSVARAAWQRFAGWLPWAEDASARTIAAAFRRAALGEDAELSPSSAVQRWKEWENHIFALRAPADGVQLSALRREAAAEVPPEATTPARPWPELGAYSMQALLTIHYVAERAFFPPGFELLDVASGFNFPLKLVHGRGDCICPVANAEDLAAAAPPGVAELLLTDGGHSQWDPGNIDAFVRATDVLAESVLEKA